MPTESSTINKSLLNKLAIGFAGVVVAALVSATGIVFAMNPHNGGDPVNPPTSKQACKDGGWQSFSDAEGKQSFKNQGQCIAWWNHHNPGYGYGGAEDDNDQDQNDDHGHENEE